MNTQHDNSTAENNGNSQECVNAALAELMDMEVLVRHIMSKEYQQAIEMELVTPMIAELILQKLYRACNLVRGDDVTKQVA